MGQYGSIIYMVVIFVAFYFLLIRPQKKKNQKMQDMRSNLNVGDQIVTIGGMVGKITSVKEDNIVVEIGADKTRLEFKKWAVGSIVKED
ncbi:MAG: preprotein translocase subunit YajC [Firmicutes bacterium]|jgi:preprotein translocase subunit YajC|nr:preprotein translocase subunit YajC [Bacillota bacterium]